MVDKKRSIPKQPIPNKEQVEKRSIPFGKKEQVYKNAIKYDTSTSPNEEFFKKKD